MRKEHYNDRCICGADAGYSDCCSPFHLNKRIPMTPEELMRSRYSAYALANTNYIKKTMLGRPLIEFNESEAKAWSESVIWLGLEVISARNESMDRGFVEFIARFLEGSKPRSIHEISEFKWVDEQWYYVNGTYPENHKKSLPMKIGRNSPCPCGSHKKFKNCHG